MIKKSDSEKLEDIVDVKDRAISLKDIETFANDKRVLKRFESAYPNGLYAKVLLILTHETFHEDVAEALWLEVVEHTQTLNRILGRNVGVAVAALDYLTNIKPTLSEPKIIEEEKSDFVADAATKDDLTALYVRDVFEIFLTKELETIGREHTSLCLLMIDIDDFKNINDTYGHLVGDELLKKIGTTVNCQIRGMDLAARYGGDEFAIIMPGIHIAQAYKAAERIRRSIENLAYKKVTATVSIGVGYTNWKISPQNLIETADNALYRAKVAGKNRVSVLKSDHSKLFIHKQKF
jgi:diguanylate cyclase (GGDEF)-like protein